MASEAAQKAAKARLKKLDAEGTSDRAAADAAKRAALRATARSGGREARKKATSTLSGMPRQFKDS